jgi:hypothetical protein
MVYVIVIVNRISVSDLSIFDDVCLQLNEIYWKILHVIYGKRARLLSTYSNRTNLLMILSNYCTPGYTNNNK